MAGQCRHVVVNGRAVISLKVRVPGRWEGDLIGDDFQRLGIALPIVPVG